MKKELAKGLCIAHRGLHDNENGVPENSMLAFQRAIENNIPIEFDLHILKDNQIVVFHDDNLKRMTGYDKDIKRCSYGELRDLKLLETDETIPLFKDVLELVDGKVLINVEFKCDNKAGILERKACEFLDNYQGKFMVQSFNPLSVKWFKDNRSHFIRGQLSYDFRDMKMNIIKRFILRKMLLNPLTKPDFISYDIHSISGKQINKIKSKGIRLFLWPIRTQEDLELAKTYGDSFIYEKINI